MKQIHVLVMASTFPASDVDPVPAFVRDQILALKKGYPHLKFSVLAPHDARSKTESFNRHTDYDEYRFHYFWPNRLEKLTGRGIIPQLKNNPFFYFLIPFLFLGELIATRRLVCRLRPDFIYAHWFTPQGIVAGIAARGTGVPVIITTHSSDVIVWKNIPFGGMVVRYFIRNSKAITAVSHRTLRRVKSFFSPELWKNVELRTKVIPMGVHPCNRSSENLNSSGGKRIVFIGRLVEIKGVHFLIAAFAEVIRAYPQTTLTIAGEGPMLSKLKEQSRCEGFTGSQVVFPGFVSGESKNKLLNDADILVVPSVVDEDGYTEGLPVSLMEGLAAGCICVATNESGADDIITDGKNGFLVPQKDVLRLAQALKRALALSPESQTKMRECSMEKARQFAWDKIAKEHYNFFFDNILNG